MSLSWCLCHSSILKTSVIGDDNAFLLKENDQVILQIGFKLNLFHSLCENYDNPFD